MIHTTSRNNSALFLVVLDLPHPLFLLLSGLTPDAMVPSMSSGLNPLMDDDFMVPDFSPIDDSRHEQDSLKRAFRQMGGDSPEMERSSYQVSEFGTHGCARYTQLT